MAEPYACLHQTFTFPEPVFELKSAKANLKRVLDTIQKKFDTAVIYVFERHASGAWHVHTLFFFFAGDDSPPSVPPTFSKDVFGWWRKIQGDKCHPAANRANVVLTACADYLLKSVRVSPKSARGQANWWGCRNKGLLAAHLGQPKEKGVRFKANGQLTPRLTFRPWKLEISKKSAREQGISWAAYKRQALGQTASVTDKQFLDFCEAGEDLRF